MGLSMADLLEKLVFSAVRSTIIDKPPRQPLWAVRIFYYDSHAPFLYLDVVMVPDEYKRKVIADSPEAAAEKLVSATELPINKLPRFSLPMDDSRLVRRTVTHVLLWDLYVKLGHDEEKPMTSQRRSLRRACRQLNSINWSERLNVTEDFFFAASDGSQYFRDDEADVSESITDEQRALLTQQGLIERPQQ